MTELADTDSGRPADHAAARSSLKRAVDIVGAGVGLLLLSPLLVVVALLIKLDSSGPVLFPQDRHGCGGRVFRIWKLRSMTASASREGFRQATIGDARITRIGHILRRSSIDELPQLINVLVGDMSLVGPRPHPLALDAEYRDAIPGYMDRYAVRPGMSGLAQVSGHRGPTPTVEAMAARVALDLDYIRRWSPSLDLVILLKTVLPWWAEVRRGS